LHFAADRTLSVDGVAVDGVAQHAGTGVVADEQD
jgi:hypothetical protein